MPRRHRHTVTVTATNSFNRLRHSNSNSPPLPPLFYQQCSSRISSTMVTPLHFSKNGQYRPPPKKKEEKERKRECVGESLHNTDRTATFEQQRVEGAVGGFQGWLSVISHRGGRGFFSRHLLLCKEFFQGSIFRHFHGDVTASKELPIHIQLRDGGKVPAREGLDTTTKPHHVNRHTHNIHPNARVRGGRSSRLTRIP